MRLKNLVLKQINRSAFIFGWCYTQYGAAYNHLVIAKNTEMHYVQDRLAYNYLGYTQDSNLTNPKPNCNRNSRT